VLAVLDELYAFQYLHQIIILNRIVSISRRILLWLLCFTETEH
jgi:hypothetical protein